MGVMAIVGPTSAAGSAAVSAVCRRSRVPHLVTLGQDVDEEAVRHPDTSVSVRLSPEQSGLSRALRDLVTRKAWSTFTLLYEDSQALVRLRELLLLSPAEGALFRLRQRSPLEDLRKVFREVGRRGESNLMLDVPAGHLREYLLQAQQVGMLTEYHNYIATSLDLHTLDLRHFYSSRCNLTGFQLVDPDKPGLKNHQDERVVAGADPLAMLSPRAKEFQRSVKSDAALAHDAVLSFARGLQALSRARSLEPKHGATCDPGSTPWAYGLSLATQIKAGSVTGLSGRVQFDSFGARTNISFNLVELKDVGLSRAGTWDATRGIHYRQNYSSLYQEVALSLRNKTFRVTTILSEPYVMLKSGSKTTASEGDRLEGFCIDLLREMALLLGFRFEIRLVRDSAYGVSNEHGEWNGLVREVMDREADLAIGDLTITLARDRAVDFTLPFMNTGIGILYRKPAQDSRLFYFLLPLSLDVWLCVLGAYLGTGALLHLVARMAPLEWRQPEQRQHSAKCDCDRSLTDKPRNVFSLYNSLWYTTTALLYQSCETNPRAASTRLVAITWWLFSLVIVSFYTANMAAFLVNEKLKFPIENVHDLARQSKIQYGCVVSGSTAAFFKECHAVPGRDPDDVPAAVVDVADACSAAGISVQLDSPRKLRQPAVGTSCRQRHSR
ncbi:glutamate receptor ionotropic, kainate 2 [Ixodes scapularis]